MKYTLTNMDLIRFPAILLVLGVVMAVPGRSQELLMGPATSESDPASLFANPALVTFQPMMVGLGAKSYYQGIGGQSGLSDFRQGYVVASKPNVFKYVVGLGVGVQYFDSPIYQRMRSGVVIGTRFLKYFSLGANVGLINVSYTESEFDLVDAGDPVFQAGNGTSSLVVDAALYVRPAHFVSFGAGIRGLNNPNLFLVGTPLESSSRPFGAVSVGYGPYRLLADVVSTPNGVEPSIFFEVGTTTGNYVRLGSAMGASYAAAQAQYRLSGPLLLNYEFQMPYSTLAEVSNGSHRVGLVFRVGDPRPPDFMPPPPKYFGVDMTGAQGLEEPKIHALAENDIVTVYERVLERIKGDDVPESALRSLIRADLGVMDSTFFLAERDLIDKQDSAISETETEVEEPISEAYRQAIQNLAESLIQPGADSLDIVVSLPELGKAAAVRNQLGAQQAAASERVRLRQANLELLPDSLRRGVDGADFTTERAVSIVPESTTFDILPVYASRSDVTAWSLEIVDRFEEPVRQFSGTSTAPEQVKWDWLDADGQVIDAGLYYYRVRVTLRNGTTIESPPRRLVVVKNVRRITFEIGLRPPEDEEGLNRRELIIRN